MTRKEGFCELDEPRPVWLPDWNESSPGRGPWLPGSSSVTVLCARSADDDEDEEDPDYFYDDDEDEDFDDLDEDLDEEFDEEEDELDDEDL